MNSRKNILLAFYQKTTLSARFKVHVIFAIKSHIILLLRLTQTPNQFKFTHCSLTSILHINVCILWYFLVHVHRSSENDLTFHFFGAENDSIKLREAINRMVEKGRIGNFSLIPSHYGLQQEPGLVLQVWFIHSSTIPVYFLWSHMRHIFIANDVVAIPLLETFQKNLIIISKHLKTKILNFFFKIEELRESKNYAQMLLTLKLPQRNLFY